MSGAIPDASGTHAGAGLLRGIDQVSAWLNRALAGLAAIALTSMMLVTVYDIGLRLLGHQVAGTYELVGWLAAAAMGLSLGYTQLHRGHVAVTIVTDRLQGRSLAVLRLVGSALSLVLIATTAYYVWMFGLMQQTTGSVSETLRFVVYPWVFVLGLGLCGLVLALLADTLRSAAALVWPDAFEA